MLTIVDNNDFPLEFICGADSILIDETRYEYALKDVKKRLKSLQVITEPSLIQKRDKCIQLLNEAEQDIHKTLGPAF